MKKCILSLLSVSDARRFYATGSWHNDTFFTLLFKLASRYPDDRALIDCSGMITWSQALHWVERISARLHTAGLHAGDRVAIWSPNRIESALILLACSRMGYVVLPSLHRDHTLNEVVALLTRCRAAAIFIQTGYGSSSKGEDKPVQIGELDHIRYVESMTPLSPDSGVVSNRIGIGDVSKLPAPADDPDTVAFLAFTSGTTAEPKGVMHSNNTYLSNARAITRDYSLNRETTVYSMSPMSHNMGTVSLGISLTAGGTLCMHSPTDNCRIRERIQETGSNYLVGVPTHGIDLINDLRPGKPLRTRRVFQIAGAAVPKSLVEKLVEQEIIVQNTYGMTENCSFLYTRPNDSVTTISEGRGIVAEGMEIAILNPATHEVYSEPGRLGEIGIRGCSQMLGYFDDQVATENSLTNDGWFLSGDLGIRYADGTVTVIGRKKDLIIRGGHNIYPAQIEDFAVRHPDIAKAAAIAVSDDRLGEKMCLCIVTTSGVDVNHEEILLHLAKQGLSKYKMPEYLIFLSEFPITVSGKILKRQLVRMVVEGDIVPQPCCYRDL